MPYAQVLIEHENSSLDRLFSYECDASVQPGMRVEVPFGRQVLQGMVFSVSDEKPDGDFAIKPLRRTLDQKPLLNAELLELAKRMAYDNIVPVMSMIRTMLPSFAQVKTGSKKPVMTEWMVKNQPEQIFEPLTEKQQALYDQLPDEIEAAAARKTWSAHLINKLKEKNAVRMEKRIKQFAALPSAKQQPWHTLSPLQQNALDYLRKDHHSIRLLHGMTGSGKTEVFFHLVKDALLQGKQVLVLVPEISLTPMMLQRFCSRFTVPVYACHSHLSPAQHLDLFTAIEHAGPCIVIGTRKAVFLPFSDLGLIIMDEEHDGSYKQDSSPRYHARDAAALRAEWHHCPLILASATPSLESYARAIKGVYGLASLPARAAGKNAAVHLVDLKTERTFANLSETLMRAMTDRLQRKEKSLILLNRRGYLPTIRCNDCREYLICEDCGLPLSYHKQEGALVCHVCGRRYPLIHTCPHCHSHSLSETGQGTERLEEDIANLFRQAVIIRMDRDTTRGKDAHARLLEEFDQHGDILLGTQMISKGLDYEDITLSAVLSADMILSRPDYRACETAYQLIEQAAGRAGRGSKPGDVYIQTFNPDHYVFDCIVRHDYRRFFQREMQYRHAGFYPPYSYMASIVISHEDLIFALQQAEQSRRMLEAQHILVLGPIEISMRRQCPRVRLILKDSDDDNLKAVLWTFTSWFEAHNHGCRAEINVHPMMLEE